MKRAKKTYRIERRDQGKGEGRKERNEKRKDKGKRAMKVEKIKEEEARRVEKGMRRDQDT